MLQPVFACVEDFPFDGQTGDGIAQGRPILGRNGRQPVARRRAEQRQGQDATGGGHRAPRRKTAEVRRRRRGPAVVRLDNDRYRGTGRRTPASPPLHVLRGGALRRVIDRGIAKGSPL